MALVVMWDKEIVCIEQSANLQTALIRADQSLGNKPRQYAEVERTSSAAKYFVYEMSKGDEKLIKDIEDPRYAQFVMVSGKFLKSYA